VQHCLVGSEMCIRDRLGTIYKPTEFWRVGVAFHTPQIIGFKDEVRASMIANTESYARTRSANSNALNSGNPGQSNYTLITPWRATASASYVFREVKDTRKQRAFVSADIEYVNYKASRFSSADPNDMGLTNYYTQLNEAVKENYKGNFNLKLGGEIKFHTVMFRLGGAYYGSPYADEALDASRMLATGGIGYRDHGIFIDLSYAHIMNQDVQFAYRLNDKPNTFAAQTGSRGTVMLTFGIKF
jgi:long-subunit fatty acid transport protein